MKKEKSCGAVVYYVDQGEKYYLLIKHVNGGHWSFAKGHVEKGESELETTLREIREETGLVDVEIDQDFRYVTTYSPKEGVMKDVIYFVGETNKESAKNVNRQVEEVTEIIWLTYKDAVDRVTYESDKEILKEANKYLG